MRRHIAFLAFSCAMLGPAATGLSQAQTTKIIDEAPATDPAEVIFSSSAMQAGLQRTGDLGELAQQNSALGDSASAYGFAAKSDEANVFLVGALYAEALAFLRSGDNALTVDRLEALQGQFIRLGVSSSLYGLVSKTSSLAQGERYPNDALVEILSLFQPFFEDYASGRSEDFLILFRAGSWLVDLSLAAASGNTALLRQEGHLEYIVAEMRRMDAPKGVMDALAEISQVAAKEEITARDTRNVIDQVKRIQNLLG